MTIEEADWDIVDSLDTLIRHVLAATTTRNRGPPHDEPVAPAGCPTVRRDRAGVWQLVAAQQARVLPGAHCQGIVSRLKNQILSKPHSASDPELG